MKPIILLIIVGSIATASGIAALANSIDINAQQFGVLFIPCDDHTENCKITNPTDLRSRDISSDESVATAESSANPWAAQRELAAMVATNNFDTPKNNEENVVTEPVTEANPVTENITESDPVTESTTEYLTELNPNDYPVKEGDQGCSVGFWINQADSQNVSDSRLLWPPGYLAEDKFGSPAYFDTKITISGNEDPSMIDALNAPNEGVGKLARQAVAALLNAAHPKVQYPLSITEVISLTKDAIATSNYSIADIFASYNYLSNSDLCS